MRHFLFPFNDVGEGARVILYGVGEAGKQYVSQICDDKCNPSGVGIVCAVDQDGYYQHKKLHEVSVSKPAILNTMTGGDYDYVVIAVDNSDTEKVIRENLLSWGVPEKKIVYNNVYYDDIVSLYSESVKPFYKPSFSYFGEDRIVKNLFTMIGIEKPTYLDVGCNHPYEGNNTALLYLTGSTGINIDANMNCIELMQKERPDDLSVCCGILTQEGEKEFFILDDYSPLNSFNETYIDNYVDHFISKKGMKKQTRKISCYTLQSFLDKYCDGEFPDYFDLDIEGMDEAVIASYDFSKNGPKVICVETHSPDVKKQLISQGYKFVLQTMHNMILIKSSLLGDAI